MGCKTQKDIIYTNHTVCDLSNNNLCPSFVSCRWMVNCNILTYTRYRVDSFFSFYLVCILENAYKKKKKEIIFTWEQFLLPFLLLASSPSSRRTFLVEVGDFWTILGNLCSLLTDRRLRKPYPIWDFRIYPSELSLWQVLTKEIYYYQVVIWIWSQSLELLYPFTVSFFWKIWPFSICKSGLVNRFWGLCTDSLRYMMFIYLFFFFM